MRAAALAPPRGPRSVCDRRGSSSAPSSARSCGSADQRRRHPAPSSRSETARRSRLDAGACDSVSARWKRLNQPRGDASDELLLVSSVREDDEDGDSEWVHLPTQQLRFPDLLSAELKEGRRRRLLEQQLRIIGQLNALGD